MPNERKGSENLSTLAFREIAKHGGAAIKPTIQVTNGITDYVYSEDKDGFQALCHGNKVADLLNMFQPHFGNPARTTTNAQGLSSFVYSISQIGVALTCRVDLGLVDGTSREITHLVVVKAAALK